MPVNARQLLINNKALGVDPLVDKILSEGDSTEKALYNEALALKSSSFKASYIEACLLASQDYAEIGKLLEIHPAIIQIYCEVFYDTRGADKLSKMELLQGLEASEYSLKLWSLSQGLDFISWRLGNRIDVDPVGGLQELFSMAMYKSKEAMFTANSSESSKEAGKWTKLAADIGRLLKAYTMSNVDSAKKDIELALEEINPDVPGFEDLK